MYHKNLLIIILCALLAPLEAVAFFGRRLPGLYKILILALLTGWTVSAVSPSLWAFDSAMPTIVENAAYQSAKSGNWNDTTTWTPAGIPSDGDTVTILSGHTVALTATGTCGTLTVQGTLSLNAASGSVLLTVGSSLNNAGTIIYENASAGNTATISSTLTASYLGAFPNWNNQSKCQFGGFTLPVGTQFNLSGSPTITLVGSITSTGGIRIGSNVTLRQKEGTEIYCSGGDFWVDGYFDMEAFTRHTYLKVDGGTDNSTMGPYRIFVQSTGYLSATGSSNTARCVFSKTTPITTSNRSTMIYLPDGASGLFKWCDMTNLSRTTTNGYNGTPPTGASYWHATFAAANVDGSNDTGRASEGLTIDNCLVTYGGHGISLVECTGTKVVNTDVWLSSNGLFCYNSTVEPNFILQNLKLYNCGWNGLYTQFRPNPNYPVIGLQAWANSYNGVNVQNMGVNETNGGTWGRDGLVFRDCIFGQYGNNGWGDIGTSGYQQNYNARVVLYNCQLMSGYEVNDIVGATNWADPILSTRYWSQIQGSAQTSQSIISFKHDGVPGLIRCWGDIRAWRHDEFRKLRYDKEMYSAGTTAWGYAYSGSGDNVVYTQKIIEIGRCYNYTESSAITSRIRLGTTSTDLTGSGEAAPTGSPLHHYMEWVGTADFPVIVRSMYQNNTASTQTGYQLYGNGSATYKAYFGAKYVVFEGMCKGLIIDTNSRISPTSTAAAGESGLDYCQFRNTTLGNWTASQNRHLTIQTVIGDPANFKNITATGCAFDTTTNWNVQVTNANLITFTNWTNSRFDIGSTCGSTGYPIRTAYTNDNRDVAYPTANYSGICWFTEPDTNLNQPLKFRVTAATTAYLGGITNWQYLSPTDAGQTLWYNATRPITTGDIVLIPTGTICIVPVTDSDKSWMCRSIETVGTGNLKFKMDVDYLGGAASGNVTLTLDEGGVIANAGTVNFEGIAATRKVTIKVNNPTNKINPVPWIYNNSGTLTWSSGLNIELGDGDFRQTMTLDVGTLGMTMTFISNMITRAVTVGSTNAVGQPNHCRLWFIAPDITPANKKTWIVQEGTVTVGKTTADTIIDGELALWPNTETRISNYTPNDKGIVVNQRGYLTASGTSSVNRNCIITSNSYIPTYLRLETNSLTKLQNCQISKMGSTTDYLYGIYVYNINGSTSNAGCLIDNCDISDMFYGISFRQAYNNITQTGLGFTNNIIRDCDIGIYFVNDSDGNTLYNNEIYNCNTGIYWETSNDTNTLRRNTVHDNRLRGMIFNANNNGGSTSYTTMPSTSNVFIEECYYNNGSQWLFDSTFAGGGVCFWASSYQNYHIFDNCIFGKDRSNALKPNYPSDVYMGAPNDYYWAFQFRNCRFASDEAQGYTVQPLYSPVRIPAEIYWDQGYNRPVAGGGAGYQGLFSYCHDQTPGLTKFWGILAVEGTHNFCYSNPTRISEYGASATPDTNVQKQLVICGIQTNTMAGYSDRIGLWVRNATSNILNMSSGNAADRPTIITTDEYLNDTNWLGFRVYGELQANYVNFSRLSALGLYVQGGNARLNPFNNVSFSNMYPTDRCLYIDGTTSLPLAQRTFSGCSFDNSAQLDTEINWSGTTVTFTNFANDNPGTKDRLTAGSVVWQVSQATSTQSGLWSNSATWGGVLPSDWANVTIAAGHTVTLSGTARINTLNINATGKLSIDASATPTTLMVPGNSAITNNGLIQLYNSTQPISWTSSNTISFIVDGTGSIDLNGKTLSLNLVDCRMPLTVPNGSVLKLLNDTVTKNITIAQGGEVQHITSGKFWWVQGDVSVSGTLKLGAGTSTKFSNASDGQYGITVESTGSLEALGSSDLNRNCYITRLGNYNPYIYIKSGATALIRYANISYLGANTANKYGIYAQGASGGLTIDRCNISGNYRGIVLDGCTNNTITGTAISNCSNVGFAILGATGSNTIYNNTIVNNSQAGVMFGGGTRSDTNQLNNLSISNNPKGVWVYSDSGSQSDLIVDSTISGSSTADIYFEPNLNGQQQLMMRNTTLGSVTKITSSDKPGNSVISRRYNGTKGVTVLAGDIIISGLKKFNYADETYPGDDDTNTQKIIYLDQAAPGFNSGKSRIKVLSGGELQVAGTASYPTRFAKLSSSPNPWSLIIEGGTITATYAAFGDLDTAGVNLGNTGILGRLDNCIFTTTAGSHITINTGVDKTITGCSFDNSGTSTISINSNGITPTILRLTNYTPNGFSAGTRDNEQNGSLVLWQSVISLTNSSNIDATSGDFYHGDQNKPVMKLKLGPISPVGSSHPEKILKKIKVWLGGQYFKDSDVLAVKIFKNIDDLDESFNPLTDTLISSGTDSLTSGVSDITLTEAQALSGTFFVVADFSDTASLDTQVRGEIKNADYFTLEAPHQMTAFSFIPASVSRVVQPASIRADIHIKRSTDTSYIGDNVYNLTGSQQTVSKNTDNGIMVTYNIRIQNDSPTTNDSFKIKGPSGGTGWTVSYYDESTSQEISADVVSVNGWKCPPGTGTTLLPGQTYPLRVEVTPAGQSVDAYKAITITAISNANSSQSLRDMVTMTTIIKPYMPDAQAKISGGSYAGGDIYDPATEQLINGNVTVNYTTTYYIKVENDGTSTSAFVITGTAAPTGWTVIYYNDETGVDITSNITGTGWNTGSLVTGNSKVIRMEAKPGQDRVGGEQKTFIIRARSSIDQTKTDQVKINLTVAGGLQPDLMVKKYTEADTSYFRNDAPYENGAATTQVISSEIREDETYITYYIRLQNDGSYADTFSVTGTSGGAGEGGSAWAISYYNTSFADITSQVTQSNGWISPSLNPGEYYIFYMRIWHTAGEVGNYKDAYVQARSVSQTSKIDVIKPRAYIASIYVVDGLISNNGVDWYVDNLKEDTPSDAQKTTQTILPNTVSTYYIKIQNDATGASDSYIITGDASGGGWTVTYYDAATGDNNITSDMINIGVGWPTGVIASDGGSRIIRVNVSYDPAQVGPQQTRETKIYMNSQSITLKRDSVKAATISQSYQPDIQVKVENSAYQYDGPAAPYSNNPADQNFSPDEWINNNQAITYYFKIANDGTTDALSGYKITATAAPANWTIRYFHDVNQNSPTISSDDVEITTDITNQTTGWSTGTITSSGGAKIIYARITPSSNVAGNTSQPVAVTALYSTYWGQNDAAQATVKVNPRYIVNTRVKKNNGVWIGDGYYPPIQSDASSVDQSVNRNGTVTYYLKISNDGNMDTTYVITGTAGGPANGGNWTVKYFYPADSLTEKTTQVTTIPAGWADGPVITFGNFIEMRVEVSPDNSVQGNTNYPVQAHAVLSSPQFTYDAVAMTTTVNKAYQPDNLVAIQGDFSDVIGDDTYASTEQKKTQSTYRNQTVTYYVKILNDGNVNEVFTLSGNAVPGWTVTYYVDNSGWVNKTAEIVAAVYNTPSITYLNSGSFTKVMVEATPGDSVLANTKANVYLTAFAKNSPSEKKDTVLVETTCLADYKVDMLVKSVTETGYSGDGFLGDMPNNPSEIKAQNVNNNQTAIYHIRIENEGNTDTTFSVTATASPEGWDIKYYHNSGNPADPNGTTLIDPYPNSASPFVVSSLAPNGVKIIRAEMKPLWDHANVAGGETRTINVAVCKSDDATIRDSVDAKTTVNKLYQADTMVKRHDEVGDGPYNKDDAPYELYNPPTSPVSQYKSGKANSIFAMTYYVKIQNDGNTNETFTVSGTGSWTGQGVVDSKGVAGEMAVVSYYDVTLADPGTDITDQILQGTHAGWPLEKFPAISSDKALLQVVVTPFVTATGGAYYDIYVIANSANGGVAKQDSIINSTVVMTDYLPDLYIMNAGEGTQTNKDAPQYLRNGPPYQTTADSTNQIKAQTIANRPSVQTVTYYIMLEQDGETTENINVTGPGNTTFGGGLWTVAYYDETGSVDITGDVTGGGKPFNLAAGATRLIRLNVTPDASVLGSTMLPVTVTATSSTGPTYKDIVIARTTVANNYQPDALVSVDNSSYYQEGPAYAYQSSAATDQAPPSGGLPIDRFNVATYYVWIQNDGNTVANILVTGTSGTADVNDLFGWTVSYYTFPARSEITSQVIGSGWTQSYDPGQSLKVLAEVTARKYSAPASPKDIIVRARATNDNSEDAITATTRANATYQADAWLRKQTDTYNDSPTTNNTWETTVSTQVKQLDVERLQPATYYITLQNDGNSSADIKIATADGGNSNWTVRFYNVTTDITSVVTSTGWSYTLAPDITKEVILVVTPGYNTPATQTYSVTMSLTSTPSGGQDQIRATTQALPTAQPDSLIALQNDFSDATGDGAYSPTAQSKAQIAPNNQAVTYYIRLQNDGNITDSFTVLGTSGDSNWTVSYYRTDTSADITSQIIQGSYTTASVLQNGTASPDIRIVASASASVQGTDSKDIKVTVASVTNPVKSDEVTAQASISVTHKPDVQAALTDDFASPVGDNKYTPTDSISTQTLAQNVDYALPVATYYVRIQNDGNYADTYTVTSSAVPSAATWQVDLGAPINQVLTAGQSLDWGTINLNKDALSSPILVKITANYGTIANDKLTFDIVAYSSSDATKRDTVRAETTFSNYYRPDVLVMKEGDGNGNSGDKTNYQFDATYEPVTQTYSSLIDNSQTLTYYIRVENDGAQSDSFTLVGNGSSTGWTVSYYKLDNTDITDSVITGTFVTAALTPYSGLEAIKVLITAAVDLQSGVNYPITITATSSQSSTVKDVVNIDHTVKVTYKIDLAVKGDAGYVGDNVYVDVNSQTVTQTVANNATVSYYIKMENEGNTADTITLSAVSTIAQGWTVSYYTIAGQEITGSTATYALAPFASTEIMVRITPSNALQAYSIQDVDFLATSAQNTALTDTARARAQVSLSTRVDLAVRGDAEFIDAQDGDNLYITAEADIADDSVQFKKHAVGLNEPTTYYIRLQNDGNYADTFFVTGTAGNSDWTVLYYELSGQTMTDITAQVAPPGIGWTSSSITVASNTVILLTLTPSLSVANDATYTVYLRASSVTNPTAADTIKAGTKYMPLEIDFPRSNKMVPQKPVVMGDAKPNVVINIVNAKTGEVLGTTQTDVNGRYRIKLPSDIPIGTVISLRPVSADQTEGVTISNLTVSDNPSTDDVPVISSPVSGTIVMGGRTTIRGQARPGSEISVQSNVESKGQSTLYNFDVVTATVDSSGYYEITVQLRGGVRALSVSCNGGISDIIDLLFVDPTGVVYDSVTGEPIKDSVVTLEYNHPVSGWMTARMGTEIGSPATVDDDNDTATAERANANPWTTGSNGRYQWNVIAGEYRLKVAHPNFVFPGNTDTMTALSKKVQEGGVDKNKDIARGTTTFAVAADVWEIDIPLDAMNNLIKITKKVNKREASIGDVLTYEVKVSNESTTRLRDVYINDIMPAGFKYIKNSIVLKIGSTDWQNGVEPTGGATRRFYLGVLTAKGTATDTMILRYQLVIGAGAVFGEYKNIASAVYTNGRLLSNEAIAKVRVIPDPLFDYSTIIGKAFIDSNENGIQDEGELGMPNVRIMTEDGITVITDKDGKYHLAAIKPQTKILKVYEGSLPFNSRVTTGNPAVVRFTGGARLEKVNFGIKTDTTGIGDKRLANFNVDVTIKEGIPHITVGKSPIPLQWGEAKQKEVRLQDIAVTMNEKSLLIDPVKGCRTDITVRLDEPAIRIWARDALGRETNLKGNVNPTKLEALVKRSAEELAVVPELGIALDPGIIEIKSGRLVRAAEFKIITNYPNFIDSWILQVLEPIKETGQNPLPDITIPKWTEHCAEGEGGGDFTIDKGEADRKARDDKKAASDTNLSDIQSEAPAGYRIFKEFKGARADVAKPILWDGRSEDGKRIVEIGQKYKFVLTVIDRLGRTDQTKEGLFSVSSQWEKVLSDTMRVEKVEVKDEFLYIPAKGFEKQAIPVEGKLYTISGMTNPANKVVISTVEMPEIISIKPLDDGSFTAELYVPVTEEELIIEAVTPDGLIKSRVSENIRIEEGKSKEEKVFVGLIDLMVGSNTRSGNTDRLDAFESVRGAQERLYKDGSYAEMRAAGFLKMRTAGDWRITASLDTDRAGKAGLRNSQNAMFKYVDPDKFYPIFGDQSTRIDEASNTAGAVFLKVEKGLSNLMVGSYNTGFTGPELAPYNRSLYGTRLHVGTTDQNSGLTLFAATARQMASHDELRGTGGSLYYLRNKDIMDGTEKVAIEVRDKVTGLVLETKTLARGDDYEIDYRYGRIIFYRPVNSVVASNTIISTEVLEGNNVYVLVDYEYFSEERWKSEAGGARIYQPIGEMLNLGVTYVKEQKDLADYTLMGADVGLKLNKYAEARIEYAKSESEGVRGFFSSNGGINDWQTLTTSALADGGSAYKAGINLDIGGLFMNRPQEISTRAYFQRVEAGFSGGGQSASQMGTDKLGVEVGAKLGEKDTVLGKFDNQKTLANANLIANGNIGAAESQTATLQLVHMDMPLKLTGEYRYQTTKTPVLNPLMKDETQQALAVRGEYKLREELTVFGEQQGTLSGKPNNQSSLGANVKLSDKITATVQETMGNAGNATKLGVTTNLNERQSVYTNYEITNAANGQKAENIVIGQKEQVSSKLGMYREERYAIKGAEDNTYGGLFGADYSLTEKWGLSASYERSDVNVASTRDALAVGVSYNSHPAESDPTRVLGYLKATARAEYRQEDSVTLDRNSYLSANNLYYQMNEDMGLTVKLNVSQTKNDTTNDVEARFIEGVLGAAYRPVKYDRYNLLGKIAYLEDQSPLAQGDMARTNSRSLVFSTEAAEDIMAGFQLVEKLAYRHNVEDFTNIKDVNSDVSLVALRMNYKVRSDKVDFLDKLTIGLEYRVLTVSLAEDQKTGVVFEIDREVGKFVHLGFGYNFVDFSDDLTEYGNGYKVQGAFIRLSTKF